MIDGVENKVNISKLASHIMFFKNDFKLTSYFHLILNIDTHLDANLWSITKQKKWFKFCQLQIIYSLQTNTLHMRKGWNDNSMFSSNHFHFPFSDN